MRDTAVRQTWGFVFRTSHFSPAPAQWKYRTLYVSSATWLMGTQ